MADEASFGIRLINQATAPARRIARAVKDVTKSMRAAEKGAAKLDRSMGDVTGSFMKLRQAGISIGHTSRDLSVFSRVAGVATKSYRKMADGFRRRGPEIFQKLREKFWTEDDFEKLRTGFGNISERLLDLAKNAAIAGGAIAILTGGLINKEIADAFIFAERTRLALSNLTGSRSGGEAAFQESIRLAKDLGLEVQDTTARYTKLLAAQFTRQRATNLIRLSADLRAIGAEAEEVKSAVRAITQIKAKGRLQAEELVGQLAEAGIATTLVYEALGKRLGKTQDEVRKLITAGKIDADLGISAIEDAVLKKANIKRAGDAGRKFANATLGGLVARLQSAPGIKFLEVAESSGRGAIELRNTLHSIIALIDGIDPDKLALFFARSLEVVQHMIPLVQSFMDGFGEGFKEILAAIGQTQNQASNTQLAFNFGKGLASLIAIAVKGFKLVAKLVAWVATPTGKWVAGLLLGIAALGKILSILSPVITGFGYVVRLSKWLWPYLATSAGWLGKIWAFASGTANLFSRWLSLIGVRGVLAALSRVAAFLGPAGLLGAAFAVGAAIGSWIDSVTGASEKLADWLTEITGLKDELEKDGKRHIVTAQSPRGVISPRAIAAVKAAGPGTMTDDHSNHRYEIHIDSSVTGSDPKRQAEEFARQAGAAMQRRRRTAAAR